MLPSLTPLQRLNGADTVTPFGDLVNLISLYLCAEINLISVSLDVKLR